MRWKFWNNKAQQPTDDIEWPTNSFESVRLLLGMFVDPDCPPFSEWRPPDVVFTSAVEPTAELAAKGYQLAQWFWMFSETYGEIAAQMARDAFCILAKDMDITAGTMAETLLKHTDEALKAAAAQLGDEVAEADGQTADAQLPEFYIAVSLLLNLPGSPYFQENELPRQGDDVNLARCLSHAASQVHNLFTSMQQAIYPFNAAGFPTWSWSMSPGAFERHLQRRHNNPLFEPERRIVTAADVYEARIKDADALNEIRQELNCIVESMGEAELPFDGYTLLNGLREQLDELVSDLQIQGGDAGNLEAYIVSVRKSVIDVWRECIKDNQEAIASLEKGEAISAAFRQEPLCPQWFGHLTLPSHPMGEELAQALMSEDISEIEKAVQMMEANPDMSEILQDIRSRVMVSVIAALHEGLSIPQLDERLRALGVTS